MVTFCVDDMVMLHITLEAHGRSYNILFEGGHRTALGMTPATFSTDDEFLIYLIEHSPEYQSGRIYSNDLPDLYVYHHSLESAICAELYAANDASPKAKCKG